MKATCRPVADRDTLSERLRSFDALLNAASPWLAVLDPAGTVKEISRAALTTLGLQRGAAVGRLLAQLPGLTQVSRAVDDALAGRTGLQEIRISNPRGGPVQPVELCLDPLFDPAGHVSAVVVEGHDVSRFQVGGVGYWSVCPAGQRLWLHPWWAPPLGFTPAELAPEDLESLLPLVHPDDRARVRQEIECIFDGGGLGRFEFRTCLPDGRVRWLATYGALRAGEGGTPRIDGITFDITDRQLADEALKRSEQLYSRLVNSLDCIVWEADGETFQFSFVSERAERILGYPAADWLEAGFWAAHVHRDDLDGCVRYWKQATQDRRDHDFEYRMISATGRTVWLHDVVRVRTEPDGSVRLCGVMVDITAHKEAEALRREIEERFRAIANDTPACLWVSSEHKGRTFFNRALSEYLGAGQDVPTEGWIAFVHPDDRERVRERSRQCVAERGTYLDEFRVRRFDGEYRLVRYQAVPRFGPPRQFLGYAGSLMDVTEARRGEHELQGAYNRLAQELAERTRAEAEIVALSRRLIDAQEEERIRIARELHDDLSQQIAGLGIALNLIRHQIPTERREACEQAERVYQRVTQIGASIRHLSHQLHPAVLEHAGLASALQTYRAEFEQLAGVKTEIQTDGHFDDVPENVSLAIFRITQEALQNVWKHSGAKKALIRLARRDHQVLLQVSDKGIGFDAAQARRPGLGLISMRERAKLLGGTLSIESEKGLGTTLTVTIPLPSATQQ
jgi:PAS domain S-box-containing protein